MPELHRSVVAGIWAFRRTNWDISGIDVHDWSLFRLLILRGFAAYLVFIPFESVCPFRSASYSIMIIYVLFGLSLRKCPHLKAIEHDRSVC